LVGWLEWLVGGGGWLAGGVWQYSINVQLTKQVLLKITVK